MSVWAAKDTLGDKDPGTRSLFGKWRQGKVVGKWEEEEKASMVLLWLLSSFPPLGRPHCRMPSLSSRNQSTREPGSQRSSSHDPAWVLLGMLSLTLPSDPRRKKQSAAAAADVSRHTDAHMRKCKEARPRGSSSQGSLDWETASCCSYKTRYSWAIMWRSTFKSTCNCSVTLVSLLWWSTQTESLNMCITPCLPRLCL